MAPLLRARPAEPRDAPAIAVIYDQGIEDRVATFETEPRTPAAVEGLLAARPGQYPAVVVEDDDQVLGFAWTAEYRPRDAYAGVAEVSIYVALGARGRGVGRLCLEALISEAEGRGFWKLVSRIFPENLARGSSRTGGRASPDASGAERAIRAFETFSCVIVERLLGSAARE